MCAGQEVGAPGCVARLAPSNARWTSGQGCNAGARARYSSSCLPLQDMLLLHDSPPKFTGKGSVSYTALQRLEWLP